MEFLRKVESSVKAEEVNRWLQDYMFLAPLSCVLYLCIVFGGQRWMRRREPYSLRRELQAWNAGLAIFSIFGFTRLTPLMLKKLAAEGFVGSVCSSFAYGDQDVFWMTVFTMSKIVEFGDTLFIVFRKTPLLFLHWYHHITVCLFTWYFAANITDSLGHWFGWMNYGVHSCMYTYYFFKSARIRFPIIVSQSVTALQLVQFVVGLLCIVVRWWYRRNGYDCKSTDSIVLPGFMLYGSYVVLFTYFFYNRYMRKTIGKTKEQ